MYRLLYAILVFLATTAARAETASTEPPKDPAALLETVRIRMVDNLMRLPNYTCLQTIERVQKRWPAKRFELLDMIRLEVALVNGRELFSWPGAGQFSDSDIDKMVTGGAIGNGNFALHAKSVFQGRPTYEFRGKELINARPAWRWDYTVKKSDSGYIIRVPPKKEAVVGFHGSFWADVATLDVLRLDVIADDIPSALEIEKAADSVEYVRTKIGSETFLLPDRSQLRMTNTDATENVNRIQFSACRQYLGESKLIFSDPAPDAAGSHAADTVIAIPNGTHLNVRLETPIVTGKTATGDPLTFTLTKPVKDDHNILFPAGALVHGRLIRLQKYNTPVPGYVVGIRVTEIQSQNRRASVTAKIEEPNVASVNSLYWDPATTKARGDLLSVEARVRSTFPDCFFVPGNQLDIRRGTQYVWRTGPDISIDEEKQ